MLPETLLDFSQLCYMVETSVLGLTLLFIGNTEVSQSGYLKRFKLMFSVMLLLIGLVTAFQWFTHLNVSHPLADAALNITLVGTASLFMLFALLPLVSTFSLSSPRQVITLIGFVAYIAVLWVTLMLFPTLSTIVISISTGLYIIELTHVFALFFYKSKTLRNSHPEPGSEEEKRLFCLNALSGSAIVLAVSAVLFILFVVITQQYRAYYYLTMLLVWGFLFVYIVNQCFKLNPLLINHIENYQPTTVITEKSPTHNELSSKVNQWVEKGGYRVPGITIKRAAQEMSADLVGLSQYVNTHYGCNFKTWTARLRIDYAKQLLATTSLTIDMVSFRSGFSSKAQFITVFKALEGCTPGMWRQQEQK